jgi:small conductance mechanosensitive channel
MTGAGVGAWPLHPTSGIVVDMTVSLDDLKRLTELYLVPTGLRIVVAALVFFAGRMLARVLTRALDRMMTKGKVDISFRKFLCDVAYALLLAAVIIAALDTLGIKTTAVLAVLGAAGLAIGLALQGSLSNFAAGVMLIVLRPYKVGDVVVLGKHLGRIEAIKVFHTIVVTGDHREVTIPNAQIIGAPIENLTVLGHRRVDLVVSVEQTGRLVEIKQLLERVVRADPRVEARPLPLIELAEITNTAAKLYLRPWTQVENYAQVAGDTMERIMGAMEEAQLKGTVALQTPSV